MLLTPATTTLAAGVGTFLTGLEVGRQESHEPLGSPARAGLHASKMQAYLETAGLGVASVALASPLKNHLPFGIGRFITPSTVTFAFAAGTLVDVVNKNREANAHRSDPHYYASYKNAAKGSLVEVAGLSMIGAGMLPIVPAIARLPLLGVGAAVLGAGWITSVGHGPLALHVRP